MRLSIVAVLTCAILAATGCGPSLEVERYQVPKPTPPTRMLGAMVPVKGGAWFFKLEGPSGLVANHVEDFWKFIESVRFREQTGEPVLNNLPDGWTLAPPQMGQMRYATVKLNTKFPLEVAVSTFEQMNMSDEEFRLANINRWRRLLSKEEVDDIDELDEVVDRRQMGDLEALCVDISGEKSSRRAAMPPVASAPPPAAGDDPAFDAPQGWEKLPPKMFSIVTFGLPDPEGDAESDPPVVTISQVGGGLAVNAARWYGQVKLPAPKSPDELASQLKPIEDAQGDAQLLVLSSDEQPTAKTLAIAIMNHDGRDWYVKFTGPRRVWEQQQEAFVALVKSIDFTGDSQ